jgi:hypothetical protein
MSRAGRKGSVQTVHVGLDEVAGDVVRLTGGGYRAVLEVAGLDLGLRDEREQEGVMAGFAAFLNGLSFPIQTLVRVQPVDVDATVERLERAARRLPPVLADLGARSRGLSPASGAQPRPPRAALLRRRPGPGRRVAGAMEPALRARDRRTGHDGRRRAADLPLRRARPSARRRRPDLPDASAARADRAVLRLLVPELSRVQRLQQDLAAHTALVVRGGQNGQHPEHRGGHQERTP